MSSWAMTIYCDFTGVTILLLCYLPSKEKECVGLAITTTITAIIKRLTTTTLHAYLQTNYYFYY